jgi:putative membrane protein
MRYLYIVLIVLLVAIVSLFKIQNLQTVTVELLGASASMPVSVLVVLIYVLGGLTGGGLLALMRTWVQGAKRRL